MLLSGVLERQHTSIYLFAGTLFFLSFLLVLLCIVTGAFLKLPALYLVVPPIACLFLIFFAVSPSPAPKTALLPASIPKFLLIAHIASIILSYATFILAFALSLLYVIKDDLLKRKVLPASFFNLPPLQDMDKRGLQLLLIGFPLLTFGLVSGAFFAQQAGGAFQELDPKITFSYALWAFYGIAILLRLLKKCTGKKSAYLVIAGFVFLLFTYVGLNFLSAGWHRYL